MKLKKSLFILSFIFLLNPLNIYSITGRAPGISLLNRKGHLVTLSNLNKNRNLVISFWATYCIPCKTEMPKLVDMEKKYSATKNLGLVFVNIDRNSDKESAINMLSQMSIRNECLFDIYQLYAKKFIPDLKIPAIFLIDKNGCIVFEAVGGKDESLIDLEKAINLLK